ncbi:MAG: hypothetical protein VX498_13995 [Myxococcota bacterium]|nr:hypothetical protein [Myxococcota bacterium]
MHLRLLLVSLVWALSGCFPQLPDPLVIDNLRVLAIQADPAVAAFTGFPPPTVTVRALVVDPNDPEGAGVEHSWKMELGDEDFDGREQLEALLPEGPYGSEITLDFAALFEERDEVEWSFTQLPLGYTSRLDDFTRESIKLVPFLVPDFQSDQGGGGNGEPITEPIPSPGAGPPPASEIPELPPEWNANPTLTELRRVGGDTWSVENGTLPGVEAPLYVGPVDSDEGLHFFIEVDDDTPTSRLSVELFRTTGWPGLPVEGEDEPDRNNLGNFGSLGSPVLDDELQPREFGWTPWSDGDDRVARLFLVLRDAEGGQSWQEIRPGEPPEDPAAAP